MVVHAYYRPLHYVCHPSDSDGSVSSGEYSLHFQVSPVKCRWEGCGEWFPHLEHLANHVTTTHAVAGNGGMFYCGWEECARGNRGFNARYKMLVHVRTHTNEKPHHCYQCGKSFSRAENLKIHARSHTGERPYVCPVPGCGKAYSNSSDRFKHTRTHSEDKPYVCKVPGCPKRYTDPSSLRKHVKTYRHYPPAASLPTLSPVQTPQSQHTSPLLALTAPLPLRPLTSSPVSVIRPLSPLPQTGIMKMETDENKYENKIDERERSDREERYCQMVPWSSVVRWWGDLPLQEAPLDLTSPLKIHHQANS